MLRVGLIGAGMIGTVHARAYKKIKNAKVVAVADINASASEKVASECQAKAFYDIQSLLSQAEIDMVDICLPTYFHKEAVLAAAKARKHVLCEKPFTLSLQDADLMIDEVQQNGIKSMIAQVVRFFPEYVTIKKIIDEGRMGKPIMVNASRLSAPAPWNSWFKDPKLSGGAILDLHIHDLDFMYHLFGKPQKVYAIGSKSPQNAWDQVKTVLDYGSHQGIIEASYLMPPEFPFTTIFQLLGDRGYLDYHSHAEGGDKVDTGKSRITIYLSNQQPTNPAYDEYDPYQAEIQYFVDCVVEGREPQHAGFLEARSVLEIVMAAIKSIETKQAIDLYR